MSFQPNMTFINLPVQDLEKSKRFFEQLGFSFNPQFTNEDAACMVINEHTFAMLLTHGHMKNFTKKAIADAAASTEVIVSFAVESREQVDAIVRKALEAGAAAASDPKDYGFMYQVGFQDLDGHIWELFYMEMSAAQ